MQNDGILTGEHGKAEMPSLQTQGVASSEILANVFAVDPIPEVEPAEQLAEYNALVQQGLWKTTTGEELRRELIDHFGEDHPVILEVDRLIRLREMKERLAMKKATRISE